MNTFLPRCFRTVLVPVLAAGVLASGVFAVTEIFAQAQTTIPGLTTSLKDQADRRAKGGYHPERMKNPNLSPHPPRFTITSPEQIPLDKLQVPPGFQVELWAHGMPGARMMTRGDKGTIFMGTRTIGRVYAVFERDGKRTSKIIADKLVQPNGVVFHKGSLYVIAIDKVLRYDNIEANLDNIPTPVDLSKAFGLPPEVHHQLEVPRAGA